MKEDLKKQKQQQRAWERSRQRWKVTIVAGLAILAAGFALSAFTTTSNSPDRPASTSAAGFRRITVDELKPQFDRGEVTLIDVRHADAYLQTHIPGALQIPLARIQGEIPYLPKDKRIVTYCACPAEESSGTAVQILEDGGVRGAAALLGGLEAWQRRGYPVESGSPSGR